MCPFQILQLGCPRLVMASLTLSLSLYLSISLSLCHSHSHSLTHSLSICLSSLSLSLSRSLARARSLSARKTSTGRYHRAPGLSSGRNLGHIWAIFVLRTGVTRSYETAPPPKDHHMTKGIVLLLGPRMGLFLYERDAPVGGKELAWGATPPARDVNDE